MAGCSTRQNTHVWLIGQPQTELPKDMLPTSRDIMKVFFQHHIVGKNSISDSIQLVIKELLDIWARARIPTALPQNIVTKLKTLVETYTKIKKNKNRKTDTQMNREKTFTREIDRIFDIAHVDALNVIKINEDRVFLQDQKTDRRYRMAGEDKDLSKLEARKTKRIEAHESMKQQEEKRKRKMDVQVELESSSSNSSDEGVDVNFKCTTENPIRGTPKCRKVPLRNVISPGLVSALDRTNLSNRKAIYVVAAAAESMGHDVNNISFSISSLRRTRMNQRIEIADSVKETYIKSGKDTPLVIHWDGKMLPAISGEHIKEDRLAILVSGVDEEKLLGVPLLARGTGMAMAEATYDAAREWKVTNRVVGMSFDTTASNTGPYNGACVLFENKIGRNLLWLACRHHIHEIILSDVFKKVFGPSSGPDIQLFRRFQAKWLVINHTSYKRCDDKRLDGELKDLKDEVIHFCVKMLQNKESKLPRDDYKELLELTLFFLGKEYPMVKPRAPGAVHQARWMAKALYTIKIYLFRETFHLTPHERQSLLNFNLFVTLIYVKPWISSPIARDAPVNDLQFFKSLQFYQSINKVIATTATSALQRHLWYLGSEMVVLSLFSDNVTTDEKRNIVQKMKTCGDENRVVRGIKLLDNKDLAQKELSDLITSSSFFLLKSLGIDISFMDFDVECWPDLFGFKKGKRLINKLKVVNDCTE